VGTGPARVATRADEIRPSSQQRSRARRSATTRTGEGGAGMARPSRGRKLAAGKYAQLLRRVLAAYGCTAAAGRLFSWTLAGRFWHWRCRCRQIAGQAERGPRGHAPRRAAPLTCRR